MKIKRKVFIGLIPCLLFSHNLSMDSQSHVNEVLTLFVNEDTIYFMTNIDRIMPKLMMMGQIPSLEILDYVLNTELLKEGLERISHDPKKWEMFMQLFSMKMNEEIVIGTLEKEMEAFLEKNEIAREDVQPFIDLRDWSSFVRALYSNGIEN